MSNETEKYRIICQLNEVIDKHKVFSEEHDMVVNELLEVLALFTGPIIADLEAVSPTAIEILKMPKEQRDKAMRDSADAMAGQDVEVFDELDAVPKSPPPGLGEGVGEVLSQAIDYAIEEYNRINRGSGAINAKKLTIYKTCGIFQGEFPTSLEYKEMRRWVDDCQSGMYINCVYCGHRYGPNDEVPATMADVLKEHIETCPKHPMSKLKSDNAALVERCEEAEKLRDDAIKLLKWLKDKDWNGELVTLGFVYDFFKTNSAAELVSSWNKESNDATQKKKEASDDRE